MGLVPFPIGAEMHPDESGGLSTTGINRPREDPVSRMKLNKIIKKG